MASGANLERPIEYSRTGSLSAVYFLAHAPPGSCYTLPTHSELTALLNMVPELVSRKLGEFYRQNFIGLHKRSVQILDEGALLRLAGRAQR